MGFFNDMSEDELKAFDIGLLYRSLKTPEGRQIKRTDDPKIMDCMNQARMLELLLQRQLRNGE